MPPQITRASALPGKAGNTKSAFFTRCVSVLPEFDQLLLDFFNIFDSRLIFTLLYNSLDLVINAAGARFRRKEVKSAAAVRVCCTHKAPVRLFWVFCFGR